MKKIQVPQQYFGLLIGKMDENLKTMEKYLGVRVSARGDEVFIDGDDENAEIASILVNKLIGLLQTGYTITPGYIKTAAGLVKQNPNIDLNQFFLSNRIIPSTKKHVSPKSFNQKKYIDAMQNNDLVFAVGPAGTGKTYLAMAMALAELQNRAISRIILTRPAVEAGEKLGFLPGDLLEKVNPYLRPLYDALYDLVELDKASKFIEKGLIEIAPIAFMRGRTLNDSFVILDEAQNTTSEQMKMFLTRLGFNSKAVVTGDITQIDLPPGKISGLREAIEILSHVDEISFTYFNEHDVVRHPLVKKIIRAYEDYPGHQRQKAPVTLDPVESI
jgi:phosphate starvation-inducible protein PhoH and related proteins